MASSSSAQARSIVSPKLYDVFISHRGPDVKETLAKQLYDLLEARGYKAFLDREEIEGGDSIRSAIDSAICSSRVQITIFSKRYAESCWCLDELLLMLQQTDALFIPVFYGVQPWELRHIDNDKSQYAAAFADYESKHRHLDKLDGWKKALASAADTSGYELSEHHPEDLCEEIVSRVVEVMEKSISLHVAKYPVGLDELVQDFERCCSKTAGSVGIFGLGGSGKTTLAKELFNKKRSGYRASCFLSDVRESHARGQLRDLQRQLLEDLLLSKEKIMSVHHGIGKLKDHLARAKHFNFNFLIVLDDIDHQDQLDALLPEGMLGSGSLVIITTRDLSVLRDVDICYEMKLMDWDHARDLFCHHAFHRRDPPADYDNLVQGFVEFCGGLPLSLMVLGAHVYKRDQYYWRLELEKVKKIQPEDIMKRLKISFDGLDKEEKQIFIDIACFFNKETNLDAVMILKASDWSVEHALEILQQKCLIERYYTGFKMHDHLRDLGRQMAHELDPPRLWQPELLRYTEENGFKQILAETKDRRLHSFFDLSLGRGITYFIAETTLLSLEIKDGDSKLCFPSWIPLPELHHLWVCSVEELWSSFQQQINAQASFQLRQLRIFDCPSSQKLPDSIQMLSHLEDLHMYGSLEETDTRSFVQSLKQLSNLRSLSLWNTKVGLEGNLDLSGRMDSLETIRLVGLKNISKLVISGEMCPRLQTLHVQWMENLKEIELKQLGKLISLEVRICWKLEKLSDFSSLLSLRVLDVHKCARLKSLSNLAQLKHLETFTVWGCPKLESVEGLDELPGLKSLLIEMPDDGCAVALHGLTRRIYLIQKVMYDVSVKLNANLFSEVIDAQAVSEIERGEYKLKMKSSLNAITIYALLITSKPTGCIRSKHLRYYHPLPSHPNWLITGLVAENYDEYSLYNTRIKKGFKVTVKVGEEGKALIVMQRIVDQLYRDVQRMGPELASYDVVKRKRKKH